MIRGAVLVALMVLGSACGGTSATTTVAPDRSSPARIVTAWLEALGSGDFASAQSMVEPQGLVLVVAAENLLSPAEVAGAIGGGMAPAGMDAYWNSFTQGFANGAGGSIDELRVRSSVPFSVGNRGFASVEVAPLQSIRSVTIVTYEAEGGWGIDLLATVGPSLVVPLQRLFDQIGPGEDSAALRELFSGGLASLQAGLLRPGGADLPSDFRREVLALLDAVRALSP